MVPLNSVAVQAPRLSRALGKPPALTIALMITLMIATVGQAQPTEEVKSLAGFELQDGFQLEKVAGDSLVHDCFCMTLNSSGNPVLSGPNYIKTLVDDNGDGFYDRAVSFTNGIKQGAHGLWAEGNRLYWVSDGGIWYADDNNRDLVADQSPRKVLDIATGGEHDAHALKRGPDGYWYLMVGNYATNVGRLVNDPNSPILRPRGGTLWRISPDFRTRAVWAHGMRNCYDFDFLPDGQIVTFESDAERESSFPWYRPTRILVLGPGSDAGWCGLTWKDHDEHLTMPLVLGAMGRSSPTGVATYEHQAFPDKYRGAAFVLDWMFGRVLCLYPNRNLPPVMRPGDRIPAEVFLQTTGEGGSGFAPTDLCVAPDGSLLISVGGRGTAGAVYRVRTDAPSANASPGSDPQFPSLFETAIEANQLTPEVATRLENLLTTPAPWESWSSQCWTKQLDAPTINSLLQVIAGDLVAHQSADSDFQTQSVTLPPTNIPLRAAQLITRAGIAVPGKVIENAFLSSSSQNHAAAWWILGRGKTTGLDVNRGAQQKWADQHPTQIEWTPWEDHLGVNATRLQFEAIGLQRWPIRRELQPALDDSDASRALRRTWLWAAAMNPSPIPTAKDLSRLDHLLAQRLHAGQANSIDSSLLDLLGLLVPDLEEEWNRRERMEFLTSLQVALGDRRLTLPPQQEPRNLHALDGYRATFESSLSPKVRAGWEVWITYIGSKAVEDGDDVLASECVRTLALFAPKESTSLAWLLSLPNPQSHPTSDINVLCSLAKCTSPRSLEQSKSTAKHLLAAFRKLKDYGLATESQWPQRAQQIITALLQVDPELGNAMLESTESFEAEDLLLLPAFATDIQIRASQEMVRWLSRNPPSIWNSAVLDYCLNSVPADSELRVAIRDAATIPKLQSSALTWLARRPMAEDSSTLLYILENEPADAAATAWKALQNLPMAEPERELTALAKFALQVGPDSTTIPASDILQRIRQATETLRSPDAPSNLQWNAWKNFLQTHSPAPEETADPQSSIDWTQVPWPEKIAAASELVGDSERGRALYVHSCIQCHGGATSLGPSLAGVTRRFSNQDLAIAIFEPNRDVSDRYKTTKILTLDEESLSGLVLEETETSVTLIQPDGKSRTIGKDEIDEISPSSLSIMPTGLMDAHSPQDFADLIKHLRSLQ